jgi:hypothetical protein
MKTLAQVPPHCFSGTALVLTATVTLAFVISCSKPQEPQNQPPPTPKTDVYTCKDRPIKIDKMYGNGVDKDPVVVCSGFHVRWSGKAPWKVSFTTSPFVGGETDITDTTDQTQLSAIKDVGADDTPFKYSATPAGGPKHDPQIIVMGK